MKALYKKAVLAAVILPLTFSTVYAKQGGHRGNGGELPLKKMLASVELTSEQQASVDSIIDNYRGSQSNRDDNRQKMLTLLKADTFSSEQAEALIAAKDAQRTANKVKKMEMTYDVYQVLTTEQQAEMDLLIEQYQGKMNKRRKGQGKNNY